MSSLLQDTELNKEQNGYINIIKRSGDSLFTIINDFLTMSSVKEGKIKLKIKPFSLNELLSDLSVIFRKETISKGIDLRIAADIGTPNDLLGDNTRIYQILQNLLTNAIKFTSQGTVQLFVREVEDLGELKMVEFVVSDTGIGIPLDKQSTIFDSFTQAHTAGNRDYMGTGLGLNIVRSLTYIMEGEVHLKSEENVGTHVTIRLPLKIATKNVAEERAKQEEISIPPSWRDKKFLMIEDNMANIIYVRELFKKWGLPIVFKETYTDGLREANDNFYDLILSDLKLPDGNGIDLLKSVRSNSKSACNQSKLSVITASISQRDKENAAELNISSYIEKPFVPEKLLSEFHKIFESSAPRNNGNIVDSHAITTDAYDLDVSHILNQLRSISSKESVQHEFACILLDQLDVDLGHLERGVKEEDFLQIYNSAHKLKSTMRILKLDAMTNSITAIEQSANSTKDIDQINKLLLTFKRNVDICIPVLTKIKVLLEKNLITV